MLAIPVAGSGSHIIEQIDNALVGWRFKTAPRKATGKVAFVAIDKDSLDVVGKWPWPRSVYADLIEKLILAQVEDIFIDIDFSTPSSLVEDSRLQSALEAAGGGIILPIFRQYRSADTKSPIVISRPIPMLADHAWLAFANVGLESDGIIRRFALGDIDGKIAVQSVPAVLSKDPRDSGSFAVDFSIDPSTLPTFSLSQIVSGKVGNTELAGRSIIVGAYATELKDIFPVPIYGTLPGAVIHALATETILQGRTLREFYQTPVELLVAAALIVAAITFRSRPAIQALAIGILILCISEAVSFVVQKDHAILIYTAKLWILMLCGTFLFMNERVDFSGFVAEIASANRRNTRRLLKKIIADSVDGVIVFDENLRIVEESSTARSLLERGEISSSRSISEVIPARLLSEIDDLIAAYQTEPEAIHSVRIEFSIPNSAATRYLEATATLSPSEDYQEFKPTSSSFVGCLIIRDVTARHVHEATLEHLSRHDDVTGLMNRREFAGRLNHLTGPYYIAILDLHRFSVLNATLGRDAGDQLLKAIASRLSEKNPSGLVGRLNGDVFCIAIPSGSATERECAIGLLAQFDQPFYVDESVLQVAVRVGICLSPIRDDDANVWVSRSEHALDDAKKAGSQAWKAYDSVAAIRQDRSRRLEREMRSALERNEFFLLYQPQVDLRTGLLVGAEALIRWKHFELGIVSPAEFIPIAEANGFILELGRWALLEACTEAQSWPLGLAVAVNVSPLQFLEGDFCADVSLALCSSGLSPLQLHLEITESAFVNGTEKIVSVLKQLQDLGIMIALDDFGTGYSSLSYIADFRLDKLKIDQSFVRKITTEPKSVTIVQTIVSLAHGLGLKVVAEGIETDAEQQILAEMGCEDGQGYYFGKPQRGQDIVALVANPTWPVALADKG